jgi:prepilin-type N-terminal cleavage/methylation domain-containing protein
MRKNNGRKGFTLIELMIVIAIIIILAAVAIPNYLNMTDRAKRSKVSSDFNTIATALEAYMTDWGHYPTSDCDGAFGKGADTDNLGALGKELTGTADAVLNNSENTTITGENGGIIYVKADTIKAMANPWDANVPYKYTGDEDGTTWKLSCDSGRDDIGVLVRTDKDPNVVKEEEETTTP